MDFNSLKGIDDEFSELILATLPKSAMSFVNLIGLKPTLALVSVFGGAEIRFVKNAASWNFEKIANVIGRDAAIKLGNEFTCAESIYVPRCDVTRRKLRDRQIIIEFDERTVKEGMSGRDATNDLAIKWGISNRQIEKIVNGKQ